MDNNLEESGVDSTLLEEFLHRVRAWDTEKMISMIDAEPQLMLATYEWGGVMHFAFKWQLTVCTVFQLAVLLHSEKMVAKMLRIAIREFGRTPPQLFDVFKGKGFKLSALEVASVWGNRCILKLLKKASKGRQIDFDKIEYSREFAEKQDLLDRLRPILNGDLEALVKGDSAAQKSLEKVRDSGKVSSLLPNLLRLRRTVREMLILANDCGWGKFYGISLKDEDYLFVLHSIAKFLVDDQFGFSRTEKRFLLMVVLRKVCEVLGPTYTTCLMKLKDNCGRTPVHLLCQIPRRAQAEGFFNLVTDFLDVMKRSCDPGFDIFDVRDYAGRTCLHHAVANGGRSGARQLQTFAQFGGDGFVEALKALSHEGITALQVAVKYNEIECLQVLARYAMDEPRSTVRIGVDGPNSRWRSWESLGTFQMAAMHGHAQILQILLKEKKVEDSGLIKGRSQKGRMPALHLAAHSGNPLAVKTLLDSGKFNPFAVDRNGDTALHSVAGSKLLKLKDSGILPVDFVDPVDYYDAKIRYPDSFNSDLQKRSLSGTTGFMDFPKKHLGGIIGCMDLLMQAGLDMDVQNKRGETPQLMPSAPDDLARWWYDKLASQSKEAKTNLVAAANAVSVTAALVATASFVGPLQPPLGLSQSSEAWLTGYSQVNHTAVQVFLFFDSLSFYLAIASIMLAVIPSMTIQKEALPLEVRIANRVVQGAIVLLLASITFVICAFSAASIAIVPESHWRYMAVAVVSIMVGGFLCLTALCLFLLRLARLIIPKNYWVDKLTTYIFFQKRKKQSPSKYESEYEFEEE